jgi:hypothetical protein
MERKLVNTNAEAWVLGHANTLAGLGLPPVPTNLAAEDGQHMRERQISETNRSERIAQ